MTAAPSNIGQRASGVMSCLAYGGCSMSMVLGNKALATYGVDLQLLPVLLQCFVAVLMCTVLGVLDFPGIRLEEMKLRTALAWLPVNVLFCCMLFTSFMALKWINVPLFQVFKTLSMVCITVGELILWGRQVSLHCWGALGLMVAGAAGATVASADEIAIRSGWGLFWMLSNVACTASYVLYMRFATSNIKLSRFGMVKYNNTLGVLLLAPVVLWKGELQTLIESGVLQSWRYGALNIFVGVVGFGINVAALWCIETTSATTYSITGNLSKIPAALMAWVLFGRQISQQGGICIGVSMTGGLLYAISKAKKPPQEDNKDMEAAIPLKVASGWNSEKETAAK
ncbi:unnamed protein product [Discosporangium mesarthrocarpum]